MLYLPSAHPGCLAPHLCLADGSSLYDHFGEGFTLLITEGSCSEADTFNAAAEMTGVPLTLLALPDTRLGHRYEARFALIRPDQHVAWRGNALPDDVHDLLATVTGASDTGPDGSAAIVPRAKKSNRNINTGFAARPAQTVQPQEQADDYILSIR